VEFQKYDGEWQFDNVSFGYSESTPPVFESVSVTAKSGDIVVVTGANGVGKTTFARLLVGLIEPIRGQVRVDGVNLLQCSASWWRKQIVYVPQEPEFFDGTLFENMTTLAPTASEENIKAVLREVGLAQLVDHHPEGLGMSITMGGKNFSLGIRRRLAIARALLTSGQLVLIDEPTEGLDAAGGQMINSVINQLKAEGRTLVICLAQASQELAQIATVIDLSEKPSPKIVRPIQNIQGLP
jgi:ATP-binding cassette subfamily C protein LapB